MLPVEWRELEFCIKWCLPGPAMQTVRRLQKPTGSTQDLSQLEEKDAPDLLDTPSGSVLIIEIIEQATRRTAC